jgi:hypothetical protein
VPFEGALRILKLNEGTRVTEAGLSLSAESDFNEKRAAETGQRFMKLLAIVLWGVSVG